MLKGIILVSERIISLDLQVNLSKYYRIVNVFKNAGLSNLNDLSGTDFFIIDPDHYSREELQNILVELNLNPEAKIIALTTQPEDKLRQSIKCKHVINKPFNYTSLLQAIEN